MHFGWKRLIPIALLWIVAVATIRSIRLEGGIDTQYLLGGIGVLAAMFVVLFFVGEKEQSEVEGEQRPDHAPAAVSEGGYPVPPMPAGGAVRGPAQALRFGNGTPVTTTTGDRGGAA
jgi:NADH-quinone oxidoreductase subunit H